MKPMAREAVDIITTVAEPFSRHCESLTFVGSCVQRENGAGDLDVIILWNEFQEVNPFMTQVTRALRDHSRHTVVIDEWGHVNAALFEGCPVIHFHNDPAVAFRHRSTLFRKSVAKYAPTLGRHLKTFAPLGQLSATEFLADRLMQMRTVELLENSFYSWHWMPVPRGYSLRRRINLTAAPVDHAISIALHAVRNWLRVCGTYQEYTAVADLHTQCVSLGEQLHENVRYLTSAKEERRLGVEFQRSACCRVREVALETVVGLYHIADQKIMPKRHTQGTLEALLPSVERSDLRERLTAGIPSLRGRTSPPRRPCNPMFKEPGVTAREGIG